MSVASDIYIGIKLSVLRLDRHDGHIVWQTELDSGLLGDPKVNIALVDGLVIAYCKGSVYAVDAETGELLWVNQLPGMGYGLCSIAGARNDDLFQQVEAEEAERRRRRD